MTLFFLSVHWEKKLSHFDLKSWVTWVELSQKHLNWKITFIVLVTQRGTCSLVILLSKIHQNYCHINNILNDFEIYFKIIWFSMWFWFSNHHFQNDLDFDFKSPLFRWFDFDFKIINIRWFCPSLYRKLMEDKFYRWQRNKIMCVLNTRYDCLLPFSLRIEKQ